AAAVPVRTAHPVADARPATPDSPQHSASARAAENADAPKSALAEAASISLPAPAAGEANAAPVVAAVAAAPALAPWQDETPVESKLSDPVPPVPAETDASRTAPMHEATPPAPAIRTTETVEASKVAATPALAPWDDAPTEPAQGEPPAAAAPQESAPASSPGATAATAFTRAEQAAPAAASQESPAVADIAPRRAGGASDALNVLRSAGLKVSSDRGRATAAAATNPAAATPKPAAPRVVVNVPTPGAPRRAPQQDAAPAARAPSPQAQAHAQEPRGSSSAPWDDMPPDEYMPLTAADEGYYGLPDDNYMPVFDSGPDDVRVNAAPAPTPAPVVDKRPLPAAVPLDPLGFQGDWPALAVDLPLKGISYQLAFNSELMALEGNTLKLNVPVPQYAEASQVAKLKTALADKLGQNVEVLVEVGPARRTAAAHDAAMRAQRQQEAEREIGADPFVQSLIREFGASIVPGSIRPITQDAGPNGAPSVH
ncbi:DNA polymerase III subunit gamma/tau C-terminal domain-containing protein, partial [Paraburkholderia fungorum]|uniref:DNA polymerase III subunit gamma/tau C-terminal domain-containing protein n=1 Tax=Paraburkholderia fungorum TaxID=134537 RepID=UPI0038BD8260